VNTNMMQKVRLKCRKILCYKLFRNYEWRDDGGGGGGGNLNLI
jgi:hypothetical protein